MYPQVIIWHTAEILSWKQCQGDLPKLKYSQLTWFAHTHTKTMASGHLLPFLVDREALHSMHFASSSVVIATDLMNISFPLSFQTHTRHTHAQLTPHKTEERKKRKKRKKKRRKETCIPSNNTKCCNIGNHTLVIPLEVWYGCVASEFHRWCQSSVWCRSLGQGCRG